MTVKLLQPFNGMATGATVALGAATETALVNALAATTNLSGGVPYAPNNPFDMTKELSLDGSRAPASSTTTGTTNSFTYDANFLYICIATDTWRRIPLEVF